MEVQIKGSLEEFEADLERIKEIFDKADLEFVPGRNVWVVKNVEKYAHIPFVASAIADRALQAILF
jgi:hypothetical protein